LLINKKAPQMQGFKVYLGSTIKGGSLILDVMVFYDLDLLIIDP
jgi:hypothetical protein